MTKIHEERANVLALKLKGLKVEQISQQLGITVAKVHSHDREIKKQMAKGDAEELASMNQEELEFAKTAVQQMLPYMRKSIDTVTKSTKTLQSIHTKALDVAERIFDIMHKKLENENISNKELKELNIMYADTYSVLYNKNGIQIVNLLASAPTEQAGEADRRKSEMREELVKMRKEVLADVIDIDTDEDDENEQPHKYNSNQVHALIAKYKLENNVPALMELGEQYPKIQTVIRDILTKYIAKVEKVEKRLKVVGLNNG